MMATETANAPINGTYGHHQANPYAAAEQNFGSHKASSTSSTAGYVSAATPATHTSSSTANPNEISKEEVAWYFVEQYYTTMSRHPEKLYVRRLPCVLFGDCGSVNALTIK